MAKIVAVVGASNNRRKFGNRALRAFKAEGHTVIPINPHEGHIEGIPAFASVLDVPGPIDMATVYVPPEIGQGLLAEFAQKGIPEVWFNPGSESEAIVAHATRLEVNVILACSIVGIGRSPEDF